MDDAREQEGDGTPEEIDLTAVDPSRLPDLRERLRQAERAAVDGQQRATAAEARLRRYELEVAEAEHKLKTALYAIQGWGETLLERWLTLSSSERQMGLYTITRRAGESIAQLERVLGAERPDEVAVELRPERIELCSTLADAVASYSGVSSRHEVTLECAPPIHAWLDRVLLREILAHLLDNAIKYSPDGGNVRVCAAAVDRNLRLDVTDEGVGVPDDVDIMRPYQRGSPQGTRGTGLGLFIVDKLAKAMGATVTFRRNDGQPGSTFSLLFPSDRRDRTVSTAT